MTPKEQERRLRDRINDGRKIWKLSPMDIKSFNLWDEYTVARDAMKNPKYAKCAIIARV